MKILAVDVSYKETSAIIAGVLFENWSADKPEDIFTCELEDIIEYIPGEFYKRELPCIVSLLKEHLIQPDCIVIDGNVYLDGISKPGLGKRLYDHFDEKVIVIGVAKQPFKGIPKECEVYRGMSEKPLYVTAAGVELNEAKIFIESMHGEFRVPTLLKQVDQICRGNL